MRQHQLGEEPALSQAWRSGTDKWNNGCCERKKHIYSENVRVPSLCGNDRIKGETKLISRTKAFALHMEKSDS